LSVRGSNIPASVVFGERATCKQAMVIRESGTNLVIALAKTNVR
jgi:hypothetical protein